MNGSRNIVVIGAGIVGMSCALYLQSDGHRVWVVDPRPPGDGASSGNAGILAYGHVAPLGMPGIVWRVPAMLFRPTGPLVIRWRYLPRLAPWLWRFVRASGRIRVATISAALGALLAEAEAAYRTLIRETGTEDLLQHRGWLKAYSTARAFRRTEAERSLMEARGVKFEIIDAGAIHDLEPALAPIFVRGIYQPDCGLVLNPKKFIDRLVAHFCRRGGQILRAAVRNFNLSENRKVVVTEAGELSADVLVLAAGAWSRPLAADLGSRVPLDTERGYHLMIRHPEKSLTRPTHWGDYYFGLAPMEHGLRLTSLVELAGLEAPPDYRRVERMLVLAGRMLPGLAGIPESRWLGFRPSLPDSLPVLGPSPRYPGVYFAFGHQHLGLTLGPVTGRIIADLVAGRDPGLDLSPYRPDRW